MLQFMAVFMARWRGWGGWLRCRGFCAPPGRLELSARGRGQCTGSDPCKKVSVTCTRSRRGYTCVECTLRNNNNNTPQPFWLKSSWPKVTCAARHGWPAVGGERLVPTFDVAAASSDIRLMRWQLRRWWEQDSESMESVPLVSLDSLAQRVTQLERVVDGLQHVPQERVQNRTPEQIVDVSVPLLTETIVEVAPSSPQERVQNRTPEQIVDVPVPLFMEAIVEVVPSSPKERVQNCTPEQTLDVPVPQLMEAIVEVVSPQERVRTPEQIVDVPVPRIIEAIVEVLPSSPQERVQNRTPEQIVDVPVPLLMETIVEVVPSSPQERVQNCTPAQMVEAIVEVVPSLPQESVQNRTPEQIVDIPVPRTIEAIVVGPVVDSVADQLRALELFSSFMDS